LLLALSFWLRQRFSFCSKFLHCPVSNQLRVIETGVHPTTNKLRAKGQELRAAALFPASTLIFPDIFTFTEIAKIAPHPHGYWTLVTSCTDSC
jgi:hypothetical protein